MESGRADRLGFLARGIETRFDPKKLFPEARTALVFAANFFRESAERRIALYAQGKDYHEVLKAKLEEISKLLENFGGIQKICLDASPIAEKLLAARAGLGSIGKSTLLIRKENGPWSLLGVILTSLELPTDAVNEASLPRCGSCTMCLDACPTGALDAELGLDARRCISNLTIERRRETLNAEELTLAEGKLFGCDECLRACPFGKNAPEAEIEEFKTTLALNTDAKFEDLESVAFGTPIARAFRKK